MKTNLLKVETLLERVTLDEIADIIPGWIHLNNRLDIGLSYVCKGMENDVHINTKDAKHYGAEYIMEFVHPESTERVVPYLVDLAKSDDMDKALSFYQKIKVKRKEYEWFFTSTKILDNDNLISITVPQSIMRDLNKITKNILDENIYLRANLKKYNQITKREKDIIKLLISGKTNREIAGILYVSELTIKTHRHNIYQKLEISNILDLVRFANVFSSGL